MAGLSNELAWLVILALFLTVSGYRFGSPKNLFSGEPWDSSLEPEGVRVIRGFRDEEHTKDFEDANESKHSRSRRASAQPQTPQIIESDLTGEKHDTLFMNWPGDQKSDGNILILARNKNAPVDSNVYLSTNVGKNWTKINSRLRLRNSKAQAVINQIYVSPLNSKLCILADASHKHIFLTQDLQTFAPLPLPWSPSFISFHPTNPNYIAGFDRQAKKVYISTNKGQSFVLMKDNVKAFWWGVQSVDTDTEMFLERHKTSGLQTKAEKYDFISKTTTPLLDNMDEFDVTGNYLFATQTIVSSKTPKLVVSYKRKAFKDTKFPANEANRDFFIFDIQDEQVFVVINHRRNLSSMYLSDIGGAKYVLSLERVLYHNPATDVSSPWLRTVVPYPFVDVHRVKTMRGVFIATQLTPGPVGRRHLRSIITYNRGGKWQRIRSPTRDISGSPIYCFLPSCSLHVNLKYGSVYRISPSENLLSATSAPGLAMALGVASTNLKIHPDLFISNDGGVNWKRALRGKHQFAFGDHGGVLVAVLYRRYTYTLRYSTNGGDSWTSVRFTSSQSKVLVEDIYTQKGEKLPVFLLYGSALVKGVKIWQLFHINMTKILGKPCTPNDMIRWIPSDDRTGLDRCQLGRQVEYRIRNWTRTCYMGKDYSAGKVLSSCQCRRADFECGFGFMQNMSSAELGCVPSPGEDLDNDLIPENCPEGTKYLRSSGYRKIPGDTCVGGEQKFFMPKLTPCPVKDLVGLIVSTSLSTSPLGVKVKTPVSFTATLTKGYLPNVNFGWEFGDGSIKVNGIGLAAAQQTHTFLKPGHYVVVLTATNTRSILVKRIGIYVEEALLPPNVSLVFSPPDPTINQEITFIVSLAGYTRPSAGLISYKWSVGGRVITTSWQSVFKYTFTTSAKYSVAVEVSNIVSVVSRSTDVSVSKDIRPQSVKAVALGARSASVTWELPMEAAVYIMGYKVFKSLNQLHGFSEAKSVRGSMATNAVIYNLTPATRYYFKVMAYTTKGDGPFSDIVSTTTNSSVPGIPDNLHAYPTSPTSMRVEWNPPKNADQKITKYTIHWWSEFSPAVIPLNLDGSVTSYEFHKLTADTLYSYEVFATSSIGSGLPAGPVHARTNTSKPQLAPRNLKQMTNNGTCVLLSWDAPFFSPNDHRPFPAKGYKVFLDKALYRKTSHSTQWVCGLIPGSVHPFGVLAYSVAGDGPKISKVIKLMPLRPSAPRNLKANVISSRSIKLLWQAPVTINGLLLNYVVYQLRPTAWEKPRRVVGDTSLTLLGLEPFTQYEFAVAANNSAGLGQRSASIIAMTREESPDAPKYVAAEVIKPESATIRLTWSQPKHPNGKITGYKITWSKTDVSEGKYDQRITTVEGNKMEYTFKHLEPATEYSFSVGAINGAGHSLGSSQPASQFTRPAVPGTARLSVGFGGAKDTAAEGFQETFITAVSKKAVINEERVAALEIQAAAVLFNVMPRFKVHAPTIEQVEIALNQSFVVGNSAKTLPGSLRLVKTYMLTTASPDTAKPPGVVGAQKGQRNDSESRTLALAVAIPITLLGVALLAGMIFYYRKYKNLEKHYTQMSGIYRAQDDELNIVYPADIPDDTHDRELLENDIKPSRKNKKLHKDEEKQPLGEHDELAMV